MRETSFDVEDWLEATVSHSDQVKVKQTATGGIMIECPCGEKTEASKDAFCGQGFFDLKLGKELWGTHYQRLKRAEDSIQYGVEIHRHEWAERGEKFTEGNPALGYEHTLKIKCDQCGREHRLNIRLEETYDLPEEEMSYLEAYRKLGIKSSIENEKALRKISKRLAEADTPEGVKDYLNKTVERIDICHALKQALNEVFSDVSDERLTKLVGIIQESVSKEISREIEDLTTHFNNVFENIIDAIKPAPTRAWEEFQSRMGR